MEESIRKFSKMHLFLELIVLISIYLFILNDNDVNLRIGLALFSVMFFISLLFFYTKLKKLQSLLIFLRALELLSVSAYVVFFENKSLSALILFVLASQMFEFIFRLDYSDLYTRIMAIAIEVLPILIFVIIDQLFFHINGEAEAIRLICIIAAIIIFITCCSEIFIEWVISYEKRVFQQRRMTENAKEMNETLKIHQEKIKKANEELGIQKIKIEAANRLVSRANSEIQVQNEVLKYISSAIEPEALASKITESIQSSMDLNFCAVLLKNLGTVNTKPLYHISYQQLPEEFIERINEDINQGKFDDMIRSGKISIEKRLPQNYYDSFVTKENISVIMIVPIVQGNKSSGAIFCGHKKQDFFDESIHLFENISAQIIMALDNTKLYAEVQQLAITDSLTGLYNRRHLNDLVELYCNKALEEQISISAALLDIDHFKKFNDRYGHVFGDKVLCHLADIVREFGEENNGIASRYGGEEFVLVFLGLDLQKTYDILVEMNDRISKIALSYDEKPVSVHVSIGVTSYPEICKSAEEVLNRADLAMYYSKQHGRNRITKDSDEVHNFFRQKAKEY